MADSPLVKGKLTWHMSQEMWEWLKSQPNQAHVLREALEQYKKVDALNEMYQVFPD